MHLANGDPRWREFVAGQKPTLFQSPTWGELIEASYGFPALVACAYDGDSIVAGLPYAFVDDFRGARRVASAFADVCEPLGDPAAWPGIERALVDEGIAWQQRSRVRPSALAQSSAEAGVHQTLELGGSVEAMSGRLHPKTKANLRQAEAAGIVGRILEPQEGIETFYALHSSVRKAKHRLLPQPRAFFDEIAARFFPDRGFVIAAMAGRKAVAAMLFLQEGTTWYYKFSASDQSALATRPNHFLLWRAIELAIEARIERIDLGISEDEGLVRFKRRFGAVETPVFVARYCQKPKTAEAVAIEATLDSLTEALTADAAPMESAQAGGTTLYRYFV
jgi:CelD/BcsL family acetyltransferase involved in cellulose biosynthesis